jgi:DNA invertase Pin-like site-specific DNA recombinase
VRALIAERVKAGMRNARAKGHRVGRPSRVPLTDQLKGEIAGAYQHNQGSLRAMATRFGTYLGTVERCVAAIKSLDRR